MDDDISTIDRAVVIAGGEMSTVPSPAPGTVVIAADSGYDHARRTGIDVDLLIGDLDSISAPGLEHARRAGVAILEYPIDKDHTDLELALAHAVDAGATRIDIHGGEAGSLGHLLGVALELTDRRWSDVDVRWHTERGVASVVRPGPTVVLDAAAGSIVSLIPVGDVTGVTTTGFRWCLEGESLEAGTSRGLRNEIVEPPSHIRVSGGALLVIVEEKTP
ncbi:MAG: thiamine diphosphokinase [Acidimicrobiia bacterium]|nr:thiamine diphosphokinase [Acidimicrobiia bacterium]